VSLADHTEIGEYWRISVIDNEQVLELWDVQGGVCEYRVHYTPKNKKHHVYFEDMDDQNRENKKNERQE